jgi:hypothetical protein
LCRPGFAGPPPGGTVPSRLIRTNRSPRCPGCSLGAGGRRSDLGSRCRWASSALEVLDGAPCAALSVRATGRGPRSR